MFFFDMCKKIAIAVNENTNSRVVLWAVFEAFILVSMTLGQVREGGTVVRIGVR